VLLNALLVPAQPAVAGVHVRLRDAGEAASEERLAA
jgi:hypothetical protein